MSNPDPNPSDNNSNKKETRISFEIGMGASALHFFQQQQEMQAKWKSLFLGLQPSKKMSALAETVRKFQDSMPKFSPGIQALLNNPALAQMAIRQQELARLPKVAPEFLEAVSRAREMNRQLFDIATDTPGLSAALAKSKVIGQAFASESMLISKATKALQEFARSDEWPSMGSFEDDGEGFSVADIDFEEVFDDRADATSSLIVEESSQVKRIITDIFQDDKALLKLEPHAFEKVVAELLRSQGFEVNLTKRTRDGGYDLIALTRLGGFPLKFLVECKRYTIEKIGIEIVRSLMYVVKQEEANKGIIATTSYFSKDAREHQQSTHPYLLDLRDKSDILSWIQQYGESILHLRRSTH